MAKIRLAIVLIALFIFGVIMTVNGVGDLIKLSGDIPDFNYESMQDIKKGDFVQGYIWNIEGCYANTTTTETTFGIETDSYVSAEYFVMPLINDKDLSQDMYITITASDKNDRDTLYRICDATWEYYGGNESVSFPDMGIIAKVQPLGSDYEDFLVEWFQYDPPYFENEAAARTHIVPYKLVIYNTSSAYVSLGVGLVILLVFFALGILVYMQIKKQREANTIPVFEQTASDFEIAAKPSENGFGESYIPPQPVPMPSLTQPTDADEFFAPRQRNTEKPAEPVKEETKEEPAAVTEVAGEMSGLDTTGMLDDEDYEIRYADDNDFTE